MKKRNNIIFIVVFLIMVVPMVYVRAASEDVLTLTATQSNGKISYSGTTSDGVIAVSCSLYDATDTEIDFKSSSVDHSAFSDTFDAVEGEYTVKCANYNGGTFKEAKVTASTTNSNTTTTTATNENTSKTTNTSNVKTGDSIFMFVILGIVSMIGVIVVVILNKKRMAKVR